MSRHDPMVTLRQMRGHALEAQEMIRGRKRSELASNRMLTLALTRLLEVLGEAANRIPPELRAQHPRIPWGRVIGLRNRLIHEYDRVDLDILWLIVRDDLPVLLAELSRILPPE
jgi:uncharacterized protein with HEPN domain